MNLVAIIILAGGAVIMAWIFLWSRQRQQLGMLVEPQQAPYELPLAANDDAVLVSTEHGQLVYANEPARRWLGMNGGQPSLEYIAKMVQPADSFLELFTGEGQSSFQLGKRWVEASSHFVPTGTERRVMVRMRELTTSTAQSETGEHARLDLNKAILVINEIGETVNASMGLDQVLQVLLTIVSKTIPADAGEICLWDEKQQVLHQRGWIGDVQYLLALADAGGMYRLDEGVNGWIARHRRPVLLADRRDPTSIQPKLSSDPYESTVAVPLILGERFIGTFQLFHSQTGFYTQADMALLQAVGTPMAVAIYNAELYGEQVQRINDMASLQQIAEVNPAENIGRVYLALNERIARLVGADMCGVLLYSEERHGLAAEGPFYGLPDAVSRGIFIALPAGSPQRDIWESQPYWVSNDVVDEPLAEALGLMALVNVTGITNTALMPMQIGGKRIGLIAVSNKRTEGGFTPRDIQNLRVLAAQATIVVENIQLFQREQRIDTELVGLQEITHAIGALSHEGEFYSEITQRIANLMGLSMCGILLYDEAGQRLVAQPPFYGIPEELIRGYSIDLKPGTLLDQMWNEDDYWYSNKVQSDTLVFEAGLDTLAEAIGVQKTLIAVLSAGGRRIGVVQVSNKLSGADFTDNDARLLLIFGTQAAAIIENARLYREVQRNADRAQSLRRVAELAGTIVTTEESFTPVLAEIARLTHSALVYVNVLDQQTGSMITYPRWVYGTELTEPIVQDIRTAGFEYSVAVSHRPYLSNQVLDDPRVLASYRNIAQRFQINRAVIVPLVVGDRSLGEIGIANSETDYTLDDQDLLSTVSAQIAAAMDRLLLYEATGQNLSRRMEELDAISRVSSELTLTVELDKVLDVIRHEAARATNADGSTVALLVPNQQWASPDQPEMQQRVGETHLMPQLADIEREAITRGADTVLVTDYRTSELKASPPHARSALAAAILYIDQIIGVIHLHHSEPNHFDERAAAFLMTLATKAALGYSNAVRYREQLERSDRLRRRVDQLNQIFELGHMPQNQTDPVNILEAIAYSVQQSVGFDTIVMTLVDETHHVLRRVAHAGLPVEVFQRTKNDVFPLEQADKLFVEKYRISESYFFPMEKVADWYIEGMNALSTTFSGNRTLDLTGKQAWRDGDMLVVVLHGSDGNLLGTMTLDRPHDNRRPDRSTVEILEIFAHQASTAIENIRLYQSSRRSAEQEARLNEVMESISSTLDTDAIMEAVAHGALRLAPFSQITVALMDVQQQGFDLLRAGVKNNGELDITRERRTTLEHTALGRTYMSGVDYLYTDGDSEIAGYQDLRSWHDSGEKTSLILPLAAGGQHLGVIHLGSSQANASALIDSRPLLKRMGQLAAVAIQNARLFNQAVNLRILNESVVMSIQQGIVVLDNSGRIISINDFMRQRFGWDDGALRQDLFAYRPDFARFLADDLRAVLETGEHQERINQSITDERNQTIISNFYIYPLRSEDAVRGAVLLVEDVTESSRLEEAVKTRANQLAALTDVSARITASLERDEVIEVAIEEMGRVVPYDTMTLWRRNGPYMVLEGAAGLPDEELVSKDFRILFSAHDHARQVVETQRAVCLSNPAPTRETFPGEETAKSWLGVPLVNQGHVVGMVVLTKNEPDFYDSAAEGNVAFAFASQVAIALANADLFEQTFERTNELGTLLEAAQATALTRDLDEVFKTVVELTFSALDVDDCAIMLWDEIDNELEVQVDINRHGDMNRVVPTGTRYKLDQYPAKLRALRERDVVVVLKDDETNPGEAKELREQGDAARLLVPLVVREQSIGLIQLEQHSAERAITQQKVRLARALGSQVAIAIENARLSTETTAQFEELLIINDLSRAISGTLNLEDMIKTVRDQVPGVTGADELYVALYDEETQEISFPLAVRGGAEFQIPPRHLGSDEVSFVIRHKQPLSLGADYYSPDEMRRNLGITNGEGDVKSYMGVPLIAGDQVMGVLAVRDTRRTRAFTLNDRRILTTVGSQLSAAIQNARLYAQVRNLADDLNRRVEERTLELEEERDRIDTLYQITSELARTLDMDRLLARALGMVAKAVGADDGAIMRIDPLTDTLYSQAVLNPNSMIEGRDGGRPAHPAEGLATWLIENEHVLLVDDLYEIDYWDPTLPGAAQWRSALAVLLETTEDIQGVMVLLSRRPHVFTESHLRLLVAAASQVAAAINNADLYQLIRDQAERLGTLLRAEQEEAEKSSAILEGIADGVILADAEGVVILFNSAAERILQLPREQVLGQPLSKMTGLYGGSAQPWIYAIEEWANRDWSAVPQTEAGDFLDERLTLGERVVSVHLSPVHINDAFLGTVSVFRDITRDVEVDRMKSEFIANVSHELRTPMTSIKGYADLLLMGAAGETGDAQRRFLMVIKENADRLTALVEDVLDISRIDSGRESLKLEQIDLTEMLPELLKALQSRPQHKKKNIDLIHSIEPDVPVISADRDKLTQIIGNIIDNAFNYTGPNGSIEVNVRLQPDEKHILISVKDTGIGIPEKFREAIWRRFERYEEHALVMEVAGTGLGLPIVKELVGMHHGDVWFESQLGVGTTFYILLPVRQPEHLKTGTAEMVKVKSQPTEEQ